MALEGRSTKMMGLQMMNDPSFGLCDGETPKRVRKCSCDTGWKIGRERQRTKTTMVTVRRKQEVKVTRKAMESGCRPDGGEHK
eukprot:scaffold2469_cov130-Amphora_coffeaeformis.AAC.1